MSKFHILRQANADIYGAERRDMDDVRVELALRWRCPGCRRMRGLVGDPEREKAYINGPLSKVVRCSSCQTEYNLIPVRKKGAA